MKGMFLYTFGKLLASRELIVGLEDMFTIGSCGQQTNFSVQNGNNAILQACVTFKA